MNIYGNIVKYSDYGTCSHCGGRVARGSRKCPHCGISIVGERAPGESASFKMKKEKTDVGMILVFIVSVIIALVVQYYCPIFNAGDSLGGFLVSAFIPFIIIFLVLTFIYEAIAV